MTVYERKGSLTQHYRCFRGLSLDEIAIVKVANDHIDLTELVAYEFCLFLIPKQQGDGTFRGAFEKLI